MCIFVILVKDVLFFNKTKFIKFSLPFILCHYILFTLNVLVNGLFARSGHMARNKLHWDANYAVGLSKQRKFELDWYEFLCSGSPTA